MGERFAGTSASTWPQTPKGPLTAAFTTVSERSVSSWGTTPKAKSLAPSEQLDTQNRKPELQYFCSRPVVDQKALVQDKSARNASKARADQKNARVVIKMSECAPIAKASTGSSSGSSLNPKVKEPPVHLKMASGICLKFAGY